MRNTRLSVIGAISGVLITFIIGGEAKAGQIGVLGLYEADSNSSAAVDERKLADVGCRLRLNGSVAGEQGDIDIDQPDKFVLLACDGSLLGDAAKRNMLGKIVSNAKPLAILEGALMDLPGSKNTGAVAQRDYILKISHYNNLDTDGRERDLAALNQAANAKPDKFEAESFILVNRASGMPTPDEVVVLFYDTPAHAKRFRKANSDIIANVGRFNKAHLNDFIYYGGKAIP